MYKQVKVTSDDKVYTLDGIYIGNKGTSWNVCKRFEVMSTSGDKTAIYGFLDENGKFYEICTQLICRPSSCSNFSRKGCRYDKTNHDTAGFYVDID